MRIEKYIRRKTNDHLRDLIIKDECEECKEVNGLELHHINPFSKLFNECLEYLGLDNKTTHKAYSRTELENMTNWMLGVQLKTRYVTLCKKCHKDIHEVG